MTEWDYEITNPLKKIKKPKANDRRERRLTEYEYNFLIKENIGFLNVCSFLKDQQ